MLAIMDMLILISMLFVIDSSLAQCITATLRMKSPRKVVLSWRLPRSRMEFLVGFIMDFPRLKGVDWLENGTAITPEWLDEWEEEHGITIGKGDVVLIRTGRWSRRESVVLGIFSGFCRLTCFIGCVA